MSVIVLLIAAGGVVAAGFLAAFAWAVKSGQFDDTTTPAVRMLLETRTTGDSAGRRATAPDDGRQRGTTSDSAGRRKRGKRPDA
jgi:cbb3-type cytochrome oxidase maturation protein